MAKPAEPKERNAAALIAGGIGVVALLVWVASLWLLAPDEPTPAERAQNAVEKQAVAPTPSPPPPPPSPAPAAAPATPPLAPAPAVAPSAPVAAAPTIEPRSAPAEARRAETPHVARAPGGASNQPQPPREGGRTQRPSTSTQREATHPAAPAPADSGAKSRAAGADSALVSMRGRYVGNLFSSASSEMIGLTLVISGLEGGVVTGTASLGGRGCNGDYPMRGKLENGQLHLRATRNGGPAGDCPLGLVLAVQGNALAGASHSGDKVQLRK